MAVSAPNAGSTGSPAVRYVEVGGVRIPRHLAQASWPDPHFDLATYDPEADLMALNMGPQHPSTHGVLRLKLWMDGETCVKCVPYPGYLHRGVEKLSESRSWAQIVLLTDRLDYVSAATSNVGYCETVEKLMAIEVPRRAKYLRVILSELQRIASHLLWLGTHAMDTGAMTVFLYAFRERELILDLFEEYCGARLTYNSMRIGGLPQDLPPSWDRKVLEFCKRAIYVNKVASPNLGELASRVEQVLVNLLTKGSPI